MTDVRIVGAERQLDIPMPCGHHGCRSIATHAFFLIRQGEATMVPLCDACRGVGIKHPPRHSTIAMLAAALMVPAT